MTESLLDHPAYAPGVVAVREHPEVERLELMLQDLGEIDGDPGSDSPLADAHRINLINRLEALKAAAAAAQARVTVAFEASQLVKQEAAGVRRTALGRGIGDQVALARGCPASQGSRHLGFAKAMSEMPHTLALLTRGEIDEWTATLLVRETAVLALDDRKVVDERLCAMSIDTTTGAVTPPWAVEQSPRRVESAARALAAELDPQNAVRRAAKGAGERRVTLRPTPDTMTYLTTMLPVAQGVAAWASLRAAARAAKAGGDQRTESQLMADLAVQRLTGQATADAVPVEIQLVMTPDTLLGTSERPARIGDCVVPAQSARDLAARTDAPRWLRRLFTDPITGVVTQLDPRRRRFSRQDARYLETRDQHCRLPRCHGAIADLDHVIRHADGGPSARTNGQGLCEAHNLVKEIPGWTTHVTDRRPGHHTVAITTPTGHTYRSHAPPGLPPPL
jgi:hypothetical protein